MRTRIAIIGGGISGLATAAWLEQDHGIRDLVVLEVSGRAGGKVASRWEEGCCLEWGPQGFLDNAPDTLELARIAGLGERLERAGDDSADRFIVRGGRPRPVPLSPPAFLTSGILPLGARLRVLLEAFAPGPPPGDESVRAFAARRIGPVAADVLVDAMVTGVYAGDPSRLSLAATFPRMAAMEREHGSLTRAMLARRRSGGGGGPAGPGGTLTTFAGGMGELSQALARGLGERLRTQAPARSIQRRPGGFEIALADGTVECERVVVATPARVSAGLLAGLAPAAVEPLREIPTAPIAMVMTAYDGPLAFGRPVTGFGILVPGREKLGILGTLFCHSIFPGQAPEGWLLLRTMLGGARDPGILELGDDALLARTRSALAKLFGADPEPCRTWIVRHPAGIAQYTLGHLDRVAAAEEAARAAGLELAGSSYNGVSVNDCIRTARAAAERVAAALTAS
jgi:oxygen-dependent protoporphyrinogen oxidase